MKTQIAIGTETLEEQFFGEAVTVKKKPIQFKEATTGTSILSNLITAEFTKALLEHSRQQLAESMRHFVNQPLDASIPLPRVETGKYYSPISSHPVMCGDGYTFRDMNRISQEPIYFSGSIQDPWCTPSRRPITGGFGIPENIMGSSNLRKGMAHLRSVENDLE